MKNKVIVFEKVSLILVPIIYLYLMFGYKIKYMQTSSKTTKMKWTKKQNIEKINCGTFFSNFYYESCNLTFKKCDGLYKNYKYNNVIKKMETIFDSKIYLAYKKTLFKNNQYAFDICLMLDSITKNYDKIIFFPSRFFELINLINFNSNKVKFPLFSYILFYINNSIEKIKHSIMILILPLWIRIHVKKIVPDIKQKKYQIGIKIYKTDWGFHSKLRSIDFLLDNKKINKNNTLFCIENDISKDYLKKLEEKNYNKVQMPKILTEVDKKFLNEILNIKFLFFCIKISILSLLEKTFLTKLSLNVLYLYLIWKQFTKNYHVNNYVTYNELSSNHVIRNIILNQNNIKTYEYAHSCNYINSYHISYAYLKQVEFSFLYCDYFISWNNRITEYLKSNPSFIKKYINNGVLWSEHIRMVMEGEFKSNILKDLQKKINIKNMKIICVFDTTFIKKNPIYVSDDDMSLFIESILKLLNDFPNIIVIFKEKHMWKELLTQEHKNKIFPLFKILKSHKRCYVPDGFDSSEVIAISDIVISACFTSSTVESLGARKKAIYFDASNKFKNCYYDKIPNFVAHGYDELKKLVKYWLYDITNEEFNEYLEKYVKGDLDAYIDGKAITRFRNLLIEEDK